MRQGQHPKQYYDQVHWRESDIKDWRIYTYFQNNTLVDRVESTISLMTDEVLGGFWGSGAGPNLVAAREPAGKPHCSTGDNIKV